MNKIFTAVFECTHPHRLHLLRFDEKWKVDGKESASFCRIDTEIVINLFEKHSDEEYTASN